MLITFDNSDKVSQFLERHKSPKLTQREIDSLNSPVFILKIQYFLKNTPPKGFTDT